MLVLIEDLDLLLLLTVQYACNANGVRIPWDRVAESLGPLFSEGAIVQHLAKLRAKRVTEERAVPPPLRRSSAASAAAAASRANYTSLRASNRGGNRTIAGEGKGKRKTQNTDEDDDDNQSGLFVEDDDDEDPDYETSIRAPKRTKKNASNTKKPKADSRAGRTNTHNNESVEAVSDTVSAADVLTWGFPPAPPTNPLDNFQSGLFDPFTTAASTDAFNNSAFGTQAPGPGDIRVQYPSSGPSPFDWAYRSGQQQWTGPGATTASAQEAMNTVDWSALDVNPFAQAYEAIDPALATAFSFAGGQPAPTADFAYPEPAQWYGESEYRMGEPSGEEQDAQDWGQEDAFADLEDDEEFTFGENDNSKFK